MFSVVGKVVYPTEQILQKVDALAWAVIGIKSWGLPDSNPEEGAGWGRPRYALGILEACALLREVSPEPGLCT